MKTNLLSSTNPLRVHSNQPELSRFLTSVVSPHLNTHHPSKKLTDKRVHKPTLSYSDNHLKKQLNSNLKGLLSPVDHKPIDLPQRGLTTKYDAERNKLLHKDPPGKVSDAHAMSPSSEIQLKEYLNKRLSLDSSTELPQKVDHNIKPKITNFGEESPVYKQKGTDIHLKNIQYVYNPMYKQAGDALQGNSNKGVIYSCAYRNIKSLNDNMMIREHDICEGNK